MMNSLRAKLLLAFLVVGLIGIALVALVTAIAAPGAFGEFLLSQRGEAMAEQLESYYRQYQGWEAVAQALPGPAQGMMHAGPRGAGTWLLADLDGRVVRPGRGKKIGDLLPADTVRLGVPIMSGDEQVGWLLPERGPIAFEPPESAFLGRINGVLFLGGLGGLAAAILLGAFLSHSFSRPLRELTRATREVAAGNLGMAVEVRSRDELGQLATAFNQMSQDLARERNQRRQMTADIAHELRTPLSIILGHAEGIAEGVLPADAKTFRVIREEAGRLERLVDELRTLSLADAGELSLDKLLVPPARLLDQAADAYLPSAQSKGIRLLVEPARELPTIHVDHDRMLQVLGNLLTNALRHTPAGGEIRLGAKAEHGGVSLWVQDSGPGIPIDEIPHVFDRFYRGDKSRTREGGGSGLGLAIAKSLVQAHGGSLQVLSAPDEGARFTLHLPLSPSPAPSA